MEIISRTDAGCKKEINEDRLLIQRAVAQQGELLLVADGLGGHPGGDVAASLVVESIARQGAAPGEYDLTEMLIKAGQTISQYGASHPEIDGMGSTGTLALVQEQEVQWAHVGDGRLYHYHNGSLSCKTRDQTLARSMYDQGRIAWREIGGHKLNHFLEQCLGEDDILPESGSFSCRPGDIILLSTDGLHDMLTDEIIMATLADSKSLIAKADRLLQDVLLAGAEDNVSCILCAL